MKKYKIINVVNSISPTSMPINEFAIYRFKNYNEQAIAICLKTPVKKIKELFKSVNIISIESSFLKFFKFLLNNSDYIFHLHQPRSAFLITFITFLLPKKFIRFVTIHNNYEKFNPYTKILIFFNVLFASKVSFVSQAGFDSFPKLLSKFFYQKLNVVTNGVDLSRVDKFLKTKTQGHKNNDKINLVYIGKLHPQKNHEKIINIINSLDKVFILTIIGDGNQRGEIENIIQRLDLRDRVNITGIISREKVYEILLKSDIFVSTALWEGMPVGVLEAMACSLPVILSPIPPHMEIQQKTQNNLICHSNLDYIKKIKSFSSMDKSELQKYGQENRRIVEEFYDLKIMHNSYNKIFENLIK